ncbi:hypothetical protein FACUT_13840 [Fusarium acutatum]|uniref:Uncharacterized protein n=1 Tax=Fusarium acutatum TaxID=78861 RepID=A0A8H4N898_9HYPO|nr:hypothetical protein FACUT_13840 [Fusarium acutatum]
MASSVTDFSCGRKQAEQHTLSQREAREKARADLDKIISSTDGNLTPTQVLAKMKELGRVEGERLRPIGRNSRMLPDVEEPIHIIMYRATCKTMDAYVEFVTMDRTA